MTDTASHDLIPPKALAFINSRARQDAEGKMYFVDDRGVAEIDTFRPGCPNHDNARDYAFHLRRTRPDLWATDAAPVETAPPPPPSTISQLMLAVREGRMSAEAAHAALPGFMNPKAVASPAASRQMTFNLSKTMAAAKSGDAAALALLQSYMK